MWLVLLACTPIQMAPTPSATPERLLTIPAWTWEGETGDRSGAVAGADVNGDGYGDMIVGEPVWSDRPHHSGRVRVWLGGPSGLADLPDHDLHLDARHDAYLAPGALGFLYFAERLSAAGDPNADGYEDVLVRGSNFVALAYGGVDGLNADHITMIPGGTVVPGGLCGLGDVDADGVDDIAIGWPGQDRLDVHFGRAGAGIEPVADQSLTFVALQAFGTSCAGGDFDGDGVRDLAVSAPLMGFTDRGQIDVHLGGPAGVEPVVAMTLSGDLDRAQLGNAIATADLDNDGDDDLIATTSSTTTGLRWFSQDAGALTAAQGLPGVTEISSLAPVLAVGDVNGDGADDVVTKEAGSGNMYALYYGGTTTWTTADAFFNTESTSECSVAIIDLQGDGREDVITGIPSSANPGRVEVYYDYDPAWPNLDGDHFPAPLDCDDANAAVFPTANERCNGRDDDCDSVADEPNAIDGLSLYLDLDGDGVGGAGIIACGISDGIIELGGDCDDADPLYADATRRWARDADGDGHGNRAGTVGASFPAGCHPPAGHVDMALADDCDDTSAAAYPGAVEVCGGVDEDCDGHTDEADALGQIVGYPDADADGFGDVNSPVPVCALRHNLIADGSDCDDDDAGISPAALERCNDVDDDCSGVADDNAPVDSVLRYVDADGDGFGDPNVTVLSCPGGAGVDDATDCDDGSGLVNPAGVDDPLTPNRLDEDCTGSDALPTLADAAVTAGAGETFEVVSASDPDVVVTVPVGTTFATDASVGLRDEDGVGTVELGGFDLHGLTKSVRLPSSWGAVSAGTAGSPIAAMETSHLCVIDAPGSFTVGAFEDCSGESYLITYVYQPDGAREGGPLGTMYIGVPGAMTLVGTGLSGVIAGEQPELLVSAVASDFQTLEVAGQSVVLPRALSVEVGGLSNTSLFVYADADGDGVVDYDEVEVHGTDPRAADSDGDGVDDGDELATGGDPSDPAGQTDPDPDRDGLGYAAELTFGTDPQSSDTDGDGVGDGVEIARGSNALDADVTLLVDVDGDGVDDLEDSCPDEPNADQADVDADGLGDACDLAEDTDTPGGGGGAEGCRCDGSGGSGALAATVLALAALRRRRSRAT